MVSKLTYIIKIRQLVVAATKRKDPNQSKARSFFQIDSFLIYSLRQIEISIVVITQNRILSQKIYCQVVFSAKVLLMTRLIMDLMAYYNEITDMYLPRSCRVTILVIITQVRVMSPLLLIPCIYLLTSNRAILLATNTIIVPTMKNNKATRKD